MVDKHSLNREETEGISEGLFQESTKSYTLIHSFSSSLISKDTQKLRYFQNWGNSSHITCETQETSSALEKASLFKRTIGSEKPPLQCYKQVCIFTEQKPHQSFTHHSNSHVFIIKAGVICYKIQASKFD